MPRQPVERARLRQERQIPLGQKRAIACILHRYERPPSPRPHEALGHGLLKARDEAKAKPKLRSWLFPHSCVSVTAVPNRPHQGEIPIALIHVDRPLPHSMARRIGEDGVRRVEAHRLRVDERRREGRRVMHLEPGARIHEERKARRVGLREAVLAETLNLREQTLAKLVGDAARAKACEELLAMLHELAVSAPRGHVATELVGLTTRVSCTDNGDLHDLLLKERHAQGALENAREARVRQRDGLLAAATAQVRVHHAALNRPRPHDGDLHHEVVEALGLEARQHGHLRARLDLKDAHRVGSLDRLVDFWALGRDARELVDGRGRLKANVVLRGHLQGFSDRRQHTEREHVDLEEAQGVEVVFVPGDDRAALHGGRLDGCNLHEGRRREHEAADVNRQVPRGVLEGDRELEDALKPLTLRVEAARAQVIAGDFAAAPEIAHAGQAPLLLRREPKDLGHLAQRRAPPVGDDLGDHGRAVTAVERVDVLNELLATLVLEVHVDVRRLRALHREKALEEQARARGVHGGDAQAVANRAVCGTSAPLAEDVATPRHAHEGLHAQEVRRHVDGRDDRELFLDLRLDGGRHGAPAVARALVGEAAQGLVGGLARVRRLVHMAWKIVTKLAHREAACGGDFQGSRDPGGLVGEACGHALGALEARAGVGVEETPGLVETKPLADALHDVVQRLLARGGVAHAVVGHERHVEALAEIAGTGLARAVEAGPVTVNADG